MAVCLINNPITYNKYGRKNSIDNNCTNHQSRQNY